MEAISREEVQGRVAHLIEWGVAGRPLAGEAESGDRHAVVPFAGGVLIGVVDGVGHGPEAVAAAKLAVATLECHARESLIRLMRRCHEALRGTRRGVVMSLARFDAWKGSMTWLGVGNVEGALVHADREQRVGQQGLVTFAGVLGSELSLLRPSVIPLRSGDVLVLATDGVASGFAEPVARALSPQRIAERILARFALHTDDALVLVARYLGPARPPGAHPGSL